MDWILDDDSKGLSGAVSMGNRFFTGNGYMGYRGTLEEYGKKEFTACIPAGLYDRVGEAWREPVNVPNAFYVHIFAGEKSLAVQDTVPINHIQRLDFRYGVHSRKSEWIINGGRVSLETERFVSMADSHLLCLKISFNIPPGVSGTVVTGIDGDVWDINGPHLKNITKTVDSGILTIAGCTGELGIPVAVSEVCSVRGGQEKNILKENKSLFRTIIPEGEDNQHVIIYKYASVYTGNDITLGADETVSAAAQRRVAEASSGGWNKLLDEHKAVWDKLWSESDITIEGDARAQRAIRYSLYQLHSIAPRHSKDLSIGARGLSGQTYKGAVFWDTEMFILPFFQYTQPKTASAILRYRIKTLDGARRKALEYGFRGAFFAWESQETGDDACSHFNVIDVFTKRPTRTYFRDGQIHISADIAHAFWNNRIISGDDTLLLEGGAEVILECARFYLSRVIYNPDKNRYEFVDVTGPDEYHERVGNNAFTNRVAVRNWKEALECRNFLKSRHPRHWETLDKKLTISGDLEKIEEFLSHVFVPLPDAETMIIPQFDGYEKLEDCTLEELKSRILDPREYWGGSSGLAVHTKIIKQADVVLMLTEFKEDYSRNVKTENWEYYESRTEHGSSLSSCLYGLLACDICRPNKAYPFFLKTAEEDLTGKSKEWAGLVYIGGTHTAASGGAWRMIVEGFAGFSIKNGVPVIDPCLPEGWNRLIIPVTHRGQRYQIDISRKESKIWKI